ncbi:flagellar motor protein MotB, partial [Klebsiella pneumoniae]|nr:flagellar motor protein MotB [Klebsiella pneumoniae]
MTAFDEDEAARAPWLMTLADLSLLLVGFFVFLQAT